MQPEIHPSPADHLTPAQLTRITCLVAALVFNAIFVTATFGGIPWLHEALQDLQECEEFRWLSIPYFVSVALLLAGCFWPSKPIPKAFFIIVGLLAPLMFIEGFFLAWLCDCSGWSFG
jgi:hypothetical protein